MSIWDCRCLFRSGLKNKCLLRGTRTSRFFWFFIWVFLACLLDFSHIGVKLNVSSSKCIKAFVLSKNTYINGKPLSTDNVTQFPLYTSKTIGQCLGQANFISFKSRHCHLRHIFFFLKGLHCSQFHWGFRTSG